MKGEIEIDESNLLIYILGAKRVRGKRGRGAGKKTPVFLLRLTCNCKQKVCLNAMVAFIRKLLKVVLLMNYCLYCVIAAI